MKTAKAISGESSSNRRAQPVRQARQNPSRSSGSHLRPIGVGDVGLRNGQLAEQNVDIFPAITCFADVISALPKELVRHFTLLKEVDAKIFAPEEQLHKLIHTALNMAPHEAILNSDCETNKTAQNNSLAIASADGSIINEQTGSISTAIEQDTLMAAVFDQANLPRRHLFRQCTMTMQEMLVSLDEKNHVLSTANEALTKQLRRIDDLYPHIEKEISLEARYGSLTHWAYSENRTVKPTDRTRREPPVISKEAQQQAEEAAARSDARKQAMLAKKGRAIQLESDFDDGSTKKPHGNSKKGRPADAALSVGLGISNGANGPTAKRRKVEKGPAGGALMERSNSGLHLANGTSKGKHASPRETPVPEPKKRVLKPTAANGPPRKRTAVTNVNPSLATAASSPLNSTFHDVKTMGRGSPLPTNGRPQGRGRQNSTQSTGVGAGRGRLDDSSRVRPASAASNKMTGTPDLSSITGAAGRSIAEVKATMKESASNTKGEHMMEDIEQDDPDLKGGLVVGNRKDGGLKREDTEASGGEMHQSAAIVPLMMTKSGRASKPSTPAIHSFPEATPRSRSARGGVVETSISAKRSHKKGAGAAAQLAAAQAVDDDTIDTGAGEEDDEPADTDEPTYCYCNGVSYGEMVACDYDGCVKEWFHLECVGLKQAPGKAKWYCDDCKEIMKGSKRFNGR